MKSIGCKILLEILLTVLFIITGCSHIPSDVQKNGIVAWNYLLPINNDVPNNDDKNKISIRVKKFQNDPSTTNLGFPWSIFRFFPIVSLLAPPLENKNRLRDDFNQTVDLKDWEIENILIEEIRKSKILLNIEIAGERKYFDLEGNVNFTSKAYKHFSGLGVFLYIGGGALLLPRSSAYISCEAHLKIISNINKKVIFEKQYTSYTKYVNGLFYGNRDRQYSAYGKEVFPVIVKQFMNDLKELPKSIWEET